MVKQLVKPQFENVLIRPLEKKKETKAGILLPDEKTQGDTIEGEVIAVGDGSYLPVAIHKIGGMLGIAKQPVEIPVGSHVVFKQFATTPLKVDGEKLLLVHQKDILAIIEYGK